MNILETPITIFDSVTSTNGRVASLAEFLNEASSHKLIQEIRMTEDKAERTRLKSNLPCATISAICPDGRKADDVFEHTGLICIDIDGQDNPGFGSGAELKAEVCKVAEVAYCSLSASGKGITVRDSVLTNIVLLMYFCGQKELWVTTGVCPQYIRTYGNAINITASMKG